MYSEIRDFLTSSPSLEAIVAYRPSEAIQQRVHYLMQAQQNGTISLAERRELAEVKRMKRFLEGIQARAHRRLSEEQAV